MRLVVMLVWVLIMLFFEVGKIGVMMFGGINEGVFGEWIGDFGDFGVWGLVLVGEFGDFGVVFGIRLGLLLLWSLLGDLVFLVVENVGLWNWWGDLGVLVWEGVFEGLLWWGCLVGFGEWFCSFGGLLLVCCWFCDNEFFFFGGECGWDCFVGGFDIGFCDFIWIFGSGGSGVFWLEILNEDFLLCFVRFFINL